MSDPVPAGRDTFYTDIPERYPCSCGEAINIALGKYSPGNVYVLETTHKGCVMARVFMDYATSTEDLAKMLMSGTNSSFKFYKKVWEKFSECKWVYA